MVAYVARRGALLCLTLLGVSFITFLMLHFAGGDPAELKLGFRSTPEALARLRHDYGLDQPLPVQYGRFLAGAVQGNFGRSFVTNSEVSSESCPISRHRRIDRGRDDDRHSRRTHRRHEFRHALSVSVGHRGDGRGSVRDLGSDLLARPPAHHRVRGGAPLVARFRSDRSEASPPVITHLLILDCLLAGNWVVLQSALAHIVLPALTLAGWPAAIIARQSRSALVQALTQDYVRTARAKGLHNRVVVVRHALRNALLPIVTVVGLEFGTLLGGAVVTETIFAWPGVGRMVLDAISARDFVLVQGTVLLFAAVFAALNLLADIVYVLLDPRIRHT